MVFDRFDVFVKNLGASLAAALLLLSGFTIGYQAILAKGSDLGVPATVQTAKRFDSGDPVALEGFDRSLEINKDLYLQSDRKKLAWVRIGLKQCTSETCLIEFRSVRVKYPSFLIVDAFGKFVSRVAGDSIDASTKGLTVTVNRGAPGNSVVGAFEQTNTRPIVAYIWEPAHFQSAERLFDKSGGLIFGGLIAVALFCGAIALQNRDLKFLLLAGWVIAVLRFTALSSGWDTEWLGFSSHSEAVQVFIRASLAAGPVLSLLLHQEILGSAFTQLEKRLSTTLMIGSVLIFFGSFTLGDGLFKLAVRSWLLVELVFFVATSIRAALREKGLVASLYGLSWLVMALGAASDAAFAIGVLKVRPDFNSQAAAICSTFVLALILSDRIRSDRQARFVAETKAKVALQRFKENYNSVPVGLATFDLSGSILHFNPAFQSLFSVGDASIKFSINDFFVGSVLVELLERLKIRGYTSFKVVPKDSITGDRAFSIQASIRDNLVEASIQDITKEYEAEIRLKRLAHYDTLTDFLNRRGLEKALLELKPMLESGTIALSIAYFDLDKFKLINDLYGYQSGDEVIKEMGRRLEGVFRAPNVLARAAGDEFIALMIGSEGEAAKTLCRHAVMEVNERSYQVGGKSFKCHVSVGIATVSKLLTVTDALAFADRACREAKSSQGDERIVLFDENEESFKRLAGEAKIEAQMGQDLPLDRFFLVAQPIVSLQSPSSNFNYEVLVRMKGDTGEVLNPGHFLKAIERNGLVSQLDRFVLRSTLQWLEQHPQHVEKLTYASVNLSGGSLNDHRFLEDALAIMQEHKDLAPKICFEITESVALGDINTTRHFADRVKSMGCMLALDDFGAGYTSFAYMKEFPADVVKIDGAYVKNMRRRSMDYAIVRAVTDLSHEIGMSVVAEWAETPDLISALAKMGVDYGQGWALGKPMEMERLLEGNCGADFVSEPELKRLLSNPPAPNFRKPGIFVPGEIRDFEGLVIPGAR
jgi:diguanylate cyclase (GGDEF)-like protein